MCSPFRLYDEDNYSFSEHAVISFSILVVLKAFSGHCYILHTHLRSPDPPWWLFSSATPPLLHCPLLSLILPSYFNYSQRGMERVTEDGDRDWRGTEVSHFKEQVKVSRCMIIRSGEGDGSSLHRLRKCVRVCSLDIQSKWRFLFFKSKIL